MKKLTIILSLICALCLCAANAEVEAHPDEFQTVNITRAVSYLSGVMDFVPGLPGMDNALENCLTQFSDGKAVLEMNDGLCVVTLTWEEADGEYTVTAAELSYDSTLDQRSVLISAASWATGLGVLELDAANPYDSVNDNYRQFLSVVSSTEDELTLNDVNVGLVMWVGSGKTRLTFTFEPLNTPL